MNVASGLPKGNTAHDISDDHWQTQRKRRKKKQKDKSISSEAGESNGQAVECSSLADQVSVTFVP